MTIDQTRDALLTGILANPADDLLRLVYADWLQDDDAPDGGGQASSLPEQQRKLNEVRGNLIRAQVHIEAGMRAEREILRTHGNDLLREDLGNHFPSYLWQNNDGTYVSPYRRGFVTSLDLGKNIQFFHDNYERISTSHPLEEISAPFLEDYDREQCAQIPVFQKLRNDVAQGVIKAVYCPENGPLLGWINSTLDEEKQLRNINRDTLNTVIPHLAGCFDHTLLGGEVHHTAAYSAPPTFHNLSLTQLSRGH